MAPSELGAGGRCTNILSNWGQRLFGPCSVCSCVPVLEGPLAQAVPKMSPPLQTGPTYGAKLASTQVLKALLALGACLKEAYRLSE